MSNDYAQGESFQLYLAKDHMDYEDTFKNQFKYNGLGLDQLPLIYELRKTGKAGFYFFGVGK